MKEPENHGLIRPTEVKFTDAAALIKFRLDAPVKYCVQHYNTCVWLHTFVCVDTHRTGNSERVCVCTSLQMFQNHEPVLAKCYFVSAIYETCI